jgi:hypothetical protein
LDQLTDVFGLGATLYKVLTGQAIATEMNRTAGLHAPTRIGKRVSDMNRPITVEIPTCVLRLIEDCCRDEAVDRLADMRAFINRVELTQTIMEHQARQSDNGARPLGKGPDHGAGQSGAEASREAPGRTGGERKASR